MQGISKRCISIPMLCVLERHEAGDDTSIGDSSLDASHRWKKREAWAGLESPRILGQVILVHDDVLS